MIGTINESGVFGPARTLWRKNFLGGVAMASPFYADFFSWQWVVLLAAPLFVALLIRRERLETPPLEILPFVLLLAVHVVALMLSYTVFSGQVVKDLVIASFLLAVFVVAGKDMLAGFFSALIPLALGTAFLGLLKAGLLDRGYLIGFILDECSAYPAGSALCVNYNSLGFLWLVAALGCIKTRFWWCIPFLLAAGALSSSRRFILLMSFVPVVWILIQGRPALVRVLGVVIATGFLLFFIPDASSFENFRHGATPYKVLELSGEVGRANKEVGRVNKEVGRVNKEVRINRSGPAVMLGTMADGTLGTSTRLDFWRLGASMVSWAPQGWHYHEVFACTFSPCVDFHYPHMSVISEWLIGGALFALVAIAFYAWPFWSILRGRRLFPVALFVLAMPYALISGDTVFSLPICISCMLVALGAVQR